MSVLRNKGCGLFLEHGQVIIQISTRSGLKRLPKARMGVSWRFFSNLSRLSCCLFLATKVVLQIGVNARQKESQLQ